MDSSDGKILHYRPEIDGLRAIAILAVLFYHANLGASGGFVGVDVFFVISGYLITGLILDSIRGGSFRLVDFWARRARRIFPALAAVVVACLIAGWLFFLPVDFKDLGQSVAAQSLLVSNIYFWHHTGYFVRPSELMPLLHTWSLGVEEQFYLLFPFVLVACAGLSRRKLGLALGGLAALSFGICIYCSYRHTSLNFFFLPTRAWELILGALLAVVPLQRAISRPAAETLGWLGVASILFAVFAYDSTTQFPGLAALPPCLGTAIVIWTTGVQSTSLRSLLACRPLVFLGLISYSLYLWHWPLLVFTKYLSPLSLSTGQRLILLAISVVLAVLSWQWIELPFRQRRLLASRSAILSFFFATTCLLLVSGLVINRLGGIPGRLPTEALVCADASTIDRQWVIEQSASSAAEGRFTEMGSHDPSRPIRLFVWGDSHAMATLPILNALCAEHDVRGKAATHSSTVPLLDFVFDEFWSLNKKDNPYSGSVINYIQGHNIQNILLVAAWSTYSDDPDQLRACLVKTIDALKSSNAKIWLMRDVPRPGFDVPRVLTCTVLLRLRKPEDVISPLTAYNSDRLFQDKLFAGLASDRVVILDPTDLFLKADQRLSLIDQGQPLYRDDNHLSVPGAMKLRPLFEPIFSGGEQEVSTKYPPVTLTR